MYYKKIDVPNFEIMVDEISKLVEPQISKNLRYWDIKYMEFFNHTPVFFRYLQRNFFRLPILFRFYNSPPFSELPPHKDNVVNARNKIGFNIPIHGTENTVMNFYKTLDDNMALSYTGFGNSPTQLLKDRSKIILVDSVVIDQPTLVRTDELHGVINQNPTYRLVLGMKYSGNTFEEVFKFNTDNV
jgi:hypothetical protein